MPHILVFGTCNTPASIHALMHIICTHEHLTQLYLLFSPASESLVPRATLLWALVITDAACGLYSQVPNFFLYFRALTVTFWVINLPFLFNERA